MMNPRVERLIDPTGDYVIIVQGTATELWPKAEFLSWYDPDYADRGMFHTSPLIEHALRFKHAGDAFECWKLQHKTVPLRSDKRPNRPLTALTVIIEKLGAVKFT